MLMFLGRVYYCFSSVIRRSLFISKTIQKNLKMDLDLWNCLERVKLVLQQNFVELILLFFVILESENPSFLLCYSMNYRDFSVKSKLIISLFQTVKLSL